MTDDPTGGPCPEPFGAGLPAVDGTTPGKSFDAAAAKIRVIGARAAADQLGLGLEVGGEGKRTSAA